jgi:response regulator RpfG family c-di-GMP phosphodiesterase
MPDKKITVLYVDDEQHNLISFKATFRLKFNIITCISGEEALKALKENEVEVIITDQRMPEMTGVEFLESVLEIHPEPMRILLTGYTDINAVIDAINKGKIYKYLTKPWDVTELEQTIETAYDVYVQRKNDKEYSQKLEVFNGQLEFLLRQKLLS